MSFNPKDWESSPLFPLMQEEAESGESGNDQASGVTVPANPAAEITLLPGPSRETSVIAPPLTSTKVIEIHERREPQADWQHPPTVRFKRRLLTEKQQRAPKTPPAAKLLHSLKMTRLVLRQIRGTVGRYPAETGGMLLGDPDTLVVTRFVFDRESFRKQNNNVYYPNTEFLNRVLEHCKEEFLGIVHSHPPRNIVPSKPDEDAAWSNITSPGNPHLHSYLMPIVQSRADVGEFGIHPYLITCHPQGEGRVIVHEVELDLID